jgi:hypothetical protein
MGLFKKIFKPVSKVLDKIIPNEIKPALPFAAAFAPFLLGPGAASGSAFQKLLFNPATRAGIMGGLNIGGQLAQEGSEGDINLLSTGLAALSGFGTAGGANQFLEGLRPASNITEFAQQSAGDAFRNRLISGAQKGVDFLQSSQSVLRPGGEPLGIMSGAKAAVLPAATATGDVMQAQARQLEKQAAIDAALAEAEALADSGARAAAIRNAMNAYGFFTDEEIEETIASAGYKAGGRVGFKFGGIDAAIEKVEDESIKESAKMVADMPDMDLMDLIEEFEIIFKRKPMNIDELKQFYRENYEMESPVRLKEKVKEKITIEAKDGGRIGFDEGGDEGDGMLKEIAKIIFRLTPAGAGIMAADEAIEMYNNLSEEDKEKVQSFGKKAMRFAGLPGLAVSAGMELSEKFKEKEMKDGGLMDLGGKEMDLRGGGFVPIGKKERADDVPARLSKNEFVMTADAVRAAGGGSVNEGAKRMYKVMNDLEARA